jgi:hypothetical protein
MAEVVLATTILVSVSKKLHFMYKNLKENKKDKLAQRYGMLMRDIREAELILNDVESLNTDKVQEELKRISIVRINEQLHRISTLIDPVEGDFKKTVDKKALDKSEALINPLHEAVNKLNVLYLSSLVHMQAENGAKVNEIFDFLQSEFARTVDEDGNVVTCSDKLTRVLSSLDGVASASTLDGAIGMLSELDEQIAVLRGVAENDQMKFDAILSSVKQQEETLEEISTDIKDIRDDQKETKDMLGVLASTHHETNEALLTLVMQIEELKLRSSNAKHGEGDADYATLKQEVETMKERLEATKQCLAVEQKARWELERVEEERNRRESEHVDEGRSRAKGDQKIFKPIKHAAVAATAGATSAAASVANVFKIGKKKKKKK